MIQKWAIEEWDVLPYRRHSTIENIMKYYEILIVFVKTNL